MWSRDRFSNSSHVDISLYHRLGFSNSSHVDISLYHRLALVFLYRANLQFTMKPGVSPETLFSLVWLGRILSPTVSFFNINSRFIKVLYVCKGSKNLSSLSLSLCHAVISWENSNYPKNDQISKGFVASHLGWLRKFSFS